MTSPKIVGRAEAEEPILRSVAEHALAPNEDSRPTWAEYERLLASHAALAELLRKAERVGSDEIAHDYDGACPDSVDPEARDPQCPACQILVAAAAALEEYDRG